ncbi:MAG: glycosyltransferase [candidate division KSB1 bacterium]|nr:glycosyltransferase [candidate division KSB1 bacterium]
MNQNMQKIVLKKDPQLAPLLSIVIPVYNEAAKIRTDILAADRFLSDNRFPGEIIVSDDGSEDTTLNAAQQVREQISAPLHVLSCPRHNGKGAAVRRGMVFSSGLFVLFADSGHCTPYHYSIDAMCLLQGGSCQLAHASRFMSNSEIVIPQPLIRQWIGRLLRRLFPVLLPLPENLTDTQCGFKMYKGPQARMIYQNLRCTGALFDLEVILNARKHGCQICEFPIQWKADPDSRTSFLNNIVKITTELISLFFRFRF